jgi:hypothetical protein
MIMPKRWRAPEAPLLIVATVFLFLGVLVYALGRSTPAYFLPDWLHSPPIAGDMGLLGGPLPAFVHTIAMVLVTAAVLRPWPGSLPFNCAAWLTIECAFEICQAAPLDERVAAALPEWFGHVAVLDGAGDFFVVGTFDYLDIVAIGLGVFIAYLVVRKISQGAEP